MKSSVNLKTAKASLVTLVLRNGLETQAISTFAIAAQHPVGRISDRSMPPKYENKKRFLENFLQL